MPTRGQGEKIGFERKKIMKICKFMCQKIILLKHAKVFPETYDCAILHPWWEIYPRLKKHGILAF